MKPHRLARVSEAIREVVAETLLFELRDPRVKKVTVTRAEVSGDLQHAKVYVSIMGDDAEQKLALHGLKHAAGFLQSKVADRLQTRYTPLLTFFIDEGVKKSLEITRLLNEALARSSDPSVDSLADVEPKTEDPLAEAGYDHDNQEADASDASDTNERPLAHKTEPSDGSAAPEKDKA
jgi:ribosome-binding factor A